MIREFARPALMPMLVIACCFCPHSGAEELSIDLARPQAKSQWMFLDDTASLRDGELLLDGRAQMSRAFFLPMEWEDVTLRAKFLVEPEEQGVLACGFVVRAQDAVTYYYVHFDRAPRRFSSGPTKTSPGTRSSAQAASPNRRASGTRANCRPRAIRSRSR